MYHAAEKSERLYSMKDANLEYENAGYLAPVSVYSRITQLSRYHIRRMIKEGKLKAERFPSRYGKSKYMYMIWVTGEELQMAYRDMEVEKECRKKGTANMSFRRVKLTLADYSQYILVLKTMRCFYTFFNNFLDRVDIDEIMRKIPEEYGECTERVYCYLTKENIQKIKEYAESQKIKINAVIKNLLRYYIYNQYSE